MSTLILAARKPFAQHTAQVNLTLPHNFVATALLAKSNAPHVKVAIWLNNRCLMQGISFRMIGDDAMPLAVPIEMQEGDDLRACFEFPSKWALWRRATFTLLGQNAS